MISKKASVFVSSLIVLWAAGYGEAQENGSGASNDTTASVSPGDVASGETKLWGQIVTHPDTAAVLARDDYELNAAAISGDTLTVTVSYGGGCADHFFALDASEPFRESDPVQLEVTFAHDANGDACERWITQDYVFDLAPLQIRYQEEYQQDSGTIVLSLEGASGDLVYEFDPAGENSAVESLSWAQIKNLRSE